MRVVAPWLFVAAALCAPAAGDDWPQFRGLHGTGASRESGLPAIWSDEENLAWKLDLPGPGSSSPVVVGDRVYVTCYSGYGVERVAGADPSALVRHVIAVDLKSGRLLWDRTVPSAVPEDSYSGQLAQHGYASSTPVADAEGVYVFFGKSGVLGVDRDGKVLWQTDVGTDSAPNQWGSASSLTATKDLVIVNANAESQSLYGIEKKTGRIAWKADAQGYRGSWSTPVLVDVKDGQEVAVYMPDEVWGLDPADGGLLWFCTGLRGAPTTTLAVQDGVVYAVGGGPRGSGSAAIEAGGRGDVTRRNVIWNRPIGAYVPSPAIVGEHLFWVDDRGTATCINTQTSEEVYRERLPGAGGVYASVVAGDGKLYAVTRRNGTFVLAAGPQFEQLAHNKFSDTTDFNATPAISQGRILLRSNRALYCIMDK